MEGILVMGPKRGRKSKRIDRIKRAEIADRRGRRVGNSVLDYERVAQRGHRQFAETLIARHNTRMRNLMELPPEFRTTAIESLGPVALLDRAHMSLGIGLVRTPSHYNGTYPRDLAWGVDSAIAAVRLLLAGQVVGASTIARQQLERWTLLLAQVAGLTRNPAEPFADFIARTWTEFISWTDDALEQMSLPEDLEYLADSEEEESEIFDESKLSHGHLVLSDGSEVCPGTTYATLSEIMHARECEDVTTWESEDLLAPHQLPARWPVPLKAVSDAITLSLVQIGALSAVLSARKGDRSGAARLANYRAWPHRFSRRDHAAEAREFWQLNRGSGQINSWTPRPKDAVTPVLVGLMPLTTLEGLAPQRLAYLDRQRWTYLSIKDGFRPAGRLYRDDEMATLVFDAHRFSAAKSALEGLRAEGMKIGDGFDPSKLDRRGTTYILVSELAALTSTWSKGTVSEALKLIGSSLRSAYWLWLEDDDRAMACLRCTLEQSARLAATIKNPRRAESIEKSRSIPSRWLQAAGWKRLSPLNEALGKYAHAQEKVDPLGPRLLLSALQIDGLTNLDAIYTARGHALDLVTEFASHSIIDALGQISTVLASSARDLLEGDGPLDLSRANKEAVLDRAWQLGNPRSKPAEQ